MAEDKKAPKVPTNFERGSQVPSQVKVPKMPTVKPVAPAAASNQNKK